MHSMRAPYAGNFPGISLRVVFAVVGKKIYICDHDIVMESISKVHFDIQIAFRR